MVMRKLSFPLKMIFSLSENVHERKGDFPRDSEEEVEILKSFRKGREKNEEKKHLKMQCSDVPLHRSFRDECVRRLLD